MPKWLSDAWWSGANGHVNLEFADFYQKICALTTATVSIKGCWWSVMSWIVSHYAKMNAALQHSVARLFLMTLQRSVWSRCTNWKLWTTWCNRQLSTHRLLEGSPRSFELIDMVYELVLQSWDCAQVTLRRMVKWCKPTCKLGIRWFLPKNLCVDDCHRVNEGLLMVCDELNSLPLCWDECCSSTHRC